METEQFETSIGRVRMNIEAPDWLAVQTVGIMVPFGNKELAHHGTWPFVYVPLVRKRGKWKLDKKSGEYPFLHIDVETEVQVPPEALDELFKLGKSWAEMHPEAFEQYDREQYAWHCGCVKDIYAQAIADLRQAERDLKKVLAEPDFKRLAASELQNRVREGTKMLHSLTLQVRAALDAMADTPSDVSECLREEIA
jgi:hypothetical protein